MTVYIGEEIVALRSNTMFNAKVAKPPTFDRDTSKMAGFI